MGRFRLFDQENDDCHEFDEDDNNSGGEPMDISSVADQEDYDYGDNDHNDHDNSHNNNNTPQTWGFVNSHRSALVEYRHHSDDYSAEMKETNSLNHHHPAQVPQQQQPIYFIVENRRDDFDNDDGHHPRRPRSGCCCCCPLWCNAILVALIGVLWYYTVTHGPPGPPPNYSACLNAAFVDDQGAAAAASSMKECQWMWGGDNNNDNQPEIKMETWNDYTQKHNAAVLQVLRAYCVDTVWHVLSWILPQIMSDARWAWRETRQRWDRFTRPTCPLATATVPKDLYAQVVAKVPTAASQPHAILPLVQRLETTLWSNLQAPQTGNPLIFWACTMWPGLNVVDIVEQIVALALPNCPTARQRPIVAMDVASTTTTTTTTTTNNDEITSGPAADLLVLEWMNRILPRIKHWNGGGGVVVLENVDQMPPLVLQRFILALGRTGQEEDGAEDIDYLHRHDGAPPPPFHFPWKPLQNVAFVLISENVGMRSMAKHLRQSGSVTEVVQSSLLLDMEHEISIHLSVADPIATTLDLTNRIAEILPFWFQSRADLQTAISTYLDFNFARSRMGWTHLHIDSTMTDEMLSDQRVEFVKWTKFFTTAENLETMENPQRAILISTNGFAPVARQMEVLKNKLKTHCADEMEQKMAYTLGYEKSSQTVVVRRDTESSLDDDDDDDGDDDDIGGLDKVNFGVSSFVCRFVY